jgi:YD repeat-containing protein
VLCLGALGAGRAMVGASVVSGSGYPNGGQGTVMSGASSGPSISASGRYVAFVSNGTAYLRDFMTGDTLPFPQAYSVRCNSEGTYLGLFYGGSLGIRCRTSNYDVVTLPATSPDFAISVDGGRIAYQSGNQIYYYSWVGWQYVTIEVSKRNGGGMGNGASYHPAMNDTGMTVAFVSDASDLVADDTNDLPDLFLWQRFGFSSGCILERVPMPSSDYDAISAPSISDDGSRIAYAVERGTTADIYVYNYADHTNLSIGSGPAGQRPAISGNGKAVAFVKGTDDKRQIYIQKLAYQNGALGKKGNATCVSKNGEGDEGNGPSWEPAISWDGWFAAFTSTSTNMIPNDTNGASDVFVNIDTHMPPNEALVPCHGDPIDLTTGWHIHGEPTDLSVYNPVGPGVSFQRTYRSRDALGDDYSPGLARGWTHNYDMYLTLNKTLTINLHLPNGQVLSFMPNPTSTTRTIPGSGITLDYPGGAITTVTMKQGRTTWRFEPIRDDEYAPVRLTNARGRYIEFHWDTDRRLTSITNDQTPPKTLLTLEYDGNGRLARIYDYHNRQVSYTFGQPAGLTAQCLLSVSQLAVKDTVNPPQKWGYTYVDYNGAPMFKSQTMPKANGGGTSTLTFDYDGDGRVIKQTDQNGVYSTYTYLPNRCTRVDVYDAVGTLTTRFTRHFDGLHRDLGTTDANGRRTIIMYEDPINVSSPTKIIAPDGRVTTYTYDAYGHVTSVRK